MVSITGTYRHSLDTAGRLIMPSKLREKTGKHFFVAIGTEGNLTLYTEDAWQRLTDKVAELPTTELAEMDVFFAYATECEADKQWRFQLPAELKDFAGIERDVVFTGNVGRIQLWAAEQWDAKVKAELTRDKIRGVFASRGI